MGFFSFLKLSQQEKDLIAQHDLPAPKSFVEDVRVSMIEHQLLAGFEKEYALFKKKLGDAMTVGHVIVCTDRACKVAGVPPIREF